MNIKPIITVLAATVLLAGCTVPVDETPAPVVTHTETSAPDPAVTEDTGSYGLDEDTIDMLFVSQILGGWPEAASAGEDSLIELGHNVCEALDSGNSVGDVLMVMLDVEDNTDHVALIVGTAVAAYCPEYTDELG